MRVAIWLACVALAAALAHGVGSGKAFADEVGRILARLISAYPDHLARIEGNWLVWRDGTRMALDDGRAGKDFATWLADPDIEDMFTIPYPAGAPAAPPPLNHDPGRARNAAFFTKMYGDCRKGEVEPHLVDVIWLPGSMRQRIRVTRINGVAERLDLVSRALDALPAWLRPHLAPAAGGYHCRSIAGTDRASPHGYGIAIDIAAAHADYWRWSSNRAAGHVSYRNRVPMEIVAIFEAHGFIWGGRWYHYDTMHFEYRPELLPPGLRAPRF
ncbi:MAG TPA: M15 family metallopeptidase [Hyphomicrobiaceae bacterium]|nr:M15 family metallopeptidase [Hyphomicrobiaceae bacterium]